MSGEMVVIVVGIALFALVLILLSVIDRKR
jgi:hypothetical protein